MKTYKILLKQDSTGVFEDVVLIKEGFIFWAFLLGFFWLLYKKIFKMSFIILGIFIVLFHLETTTLISSNISSLIGIAIFVLIGYEASDWYEKSLTKRGYKLLGYSSGRDMEEARLKFLNNLNDKNQQKLKVKVF